MEEALTQQQLAAAELSRKRVEALSFARAQEAEQASAVAPQKLGLLLFLVFLQGLWVLDMADIFTMGFALLWVTIPVNLLFWWYLSSSPRWEGKRTWITLALLADSIPFVCLFPWRTMAFLFENLDQLSFVLNLGARVAKYLGPEAAPVAAGLKVAATATGAAARVKEGDYRGALRAGTSTLVQSKNLKALGSRASTMPTLSTQRSEDIKLRPDAVKRGPDAVKRGPDTVRIVS